jgi:DNA-binding NtrC family response regulator
MWILARTPTRRPVGGVEDEVIECLSSHTWPGNVSELEAVLTQALAVGKGPLIELRDLPRALRVRDIDEVAPHSPEQQFSLAAAERAAVDRAMRHARGNKRRAARLLQIGKTTLYRKLRRYAEQDASR